MKINTISEIFKYAKIAALVVSIVIVLVYVKFPDKSISLYPNANNQWQLFTDNFIDGNSSAVHIGNQNNAIHCQMGTKGAERLCGNVLSFFDSSGEAKIRKDKEYDTYNKKPHRTHDFSEFKGLKIKLQYKGDADRIRFSLTNFEPQDKSSDSDRFYRFMHSYAYIEELSQPIFLNFSEFNVADWWVTQYRLQRGQTLPRFDRISGLFVEISNSKINSQHDITIESVELIGDWISKENLYLCFILFWSALLIVEAAWRVSNLYKRQQSTQHALVALKHHYKSLQSIAYQDELTGLFNRRALSTIIEKVFAKGAAPNMAIIIIDIDNFKHVNDDYGHDIGDQVLRQLAKLLKENTRSHDNLGRWGGEEFLLITEQPSVQNTLQFAEKLRKVIANNPLIISTAIMPVIAVTISVGFTLTHDRETFESAFERADQALYQAKAQGKNCCRGL